MLVKRQAERIRALGEEKNAAGEEGAKGGRNYRPFGSCNHIISASRFLAYSCAGLYLYSGVAKFISPNDSFETVRLLSKNLLGLDIPYSLITLSIFTLVAWEVTLGILFIIGNVRRTVLWAFMATNAFFLIVSHYLNYINRLESCGCMGGPNKAFSAIHFPFLYTFSVAIIILLIAKKPKNKGHDLNEGQINKRDSVSNVRGLIYVGKPAKKGFIPERKNP